MPGVHHSLKPAKSARVSAGGFRLPGGERLRSFPRISFPLKTTMFKDATSTPLHELLDQGRARGYSPNRVAEPIRTYRRFDRVSPAGYTFRKTGRKPYF